MGNEHSSGANADDLRLHNVPIKLPTGESKWPHSAFAFLLTSNDDFTHNYVTFEPHFSVILFSFSSTLVWSDPPT